jgi:enolase-phosphatase E1
MSAPAAILLDIEGTIAPIAFVYDVLFPYARRELPGFLQAHWNEPRVREARIQAAADAGVAAFQRPELCAHLLNLMDQDAKTTGLKALQGLIWERGYAAGALRSELFADVPAAIRGWHASSLDVAIYSSGSVAAQRVFLANTEFGDLTPLIVAYYDTTTGAKKSADSYTRIATDLSQPAGRIVFFSDVPGELDAAASAGMTAVLVVRPGNAPVGQCAHPRVESLAETERYVQTARSAARTR